MGRTATTTHAGRAFGGASPTTPTARAFGFGFGSGSRTPPTPSTPTPTTPRAPILIVASGSRDEYSPTSPAHAAVEALAKLGARSCIEDDLASALYGDTDPDAELEQEAHPFAHTRSLLTVLREPDGVDIAAERAFYDQFPPADDSASVNSHSRRPASVADARSLISGDIALDDNTGTTACFARDVCISGWTRVGDAKAGFVVFNCAVTTKEGVTIRVLKRFSAFETLHRSLRQTLPGAIPRLPPKAPLAKYRPAFLERRRAMLEKWLAAVLLHPQIGGCPATREWLVA